MLIKLLPAIYSLRSDVVTHFVYFLSATKEFLLFFKPGSFNGVSSKFKGCLKFEGCFMEVSRTFQGSFEDVYRKFQGILN